MPISKIQSASMPDSIAIDTDVLVVDGTNNRVGVGRDAPLRDFEIYGAGAEMSLVDTNQSTDRKTMNWFMSGDKAYWRMLNDAQTAGGGNVSVDFDGNLTAAGYVTGGAGSIVQQAVRSTVTYMTINPVNNWTEVHNNFRLTFTPKFSNSKIVVTYAIPLNPTGAANILFGFKPFRLVSGTYYDFSTTGGALGTRNLMQSAFARSNNGYDVNDMNQYTLIGVDEPSTTSSVTYGFYYSSEGTNNTLFCHSNGNNSNWGWTAPLHIVATEIRQ